MEDRLLTARDVATKTQLSSAGIRRMTRRGEIPGAINLGTPNRPIWRYDPREVAAWIDRRRQ
ncbi:helix-turn-helix transcriptional regulator [Flexivirga alba]|uniref:Helix-turn-helix transcriptional regulator n=1 Tax=Flexivirga alba TaxID=702742 RepID=A0ABW2AL66_9MICO